MPQPVHYVPIVTTFFALIFSALVFRRYFQKGKGAHLLWWAFGILVYGVGTFTEAAITLFGWNEPIFRAWYISGALLGGAPLAQGTVYLLLKRKTAHILTCILVPFIVIAGCCVMASPIDYSLVDPYVPTGKVLVWNWVRLFSPFINTYALIFLAGGAALSAYRFEKNRQTYDRFVGNVLITVGAILPAIGGTFTRFGYTEVLYVTELLGLSLIYMGYRYNIRESFVVSEPELAKA